ncbi:MAG: SMR family transporter [Myxococcota bacterium]
MDQHSWALAAIFASALLHATWNALLKATRDQGAASVLIVTIAGALTGLLALVVGPAAVPTAGWPYIAISGVVEGIYFVSLAAALAHLPLGTAYGLSRGAGLLIIWPFSIALFGEHLDLRTAVGAAALSLGLLILIERGNSRRGLVAAVVCALSVAAYPLAYKQALVVGVPPYPLFALSLTLSLPVQLVLLRTRRLTRLRAAMRQTPWRIGVAGVLCAASFLLFLVALEVSGPGRITALRNTSVIFAWLLGALASGTWTRRSAVSAVAIAIGAVLLSW